MEKQRLYSPIQVAIASFLGGPMAMTYVLWRNFQTLHKPKGVALTLSVGILINAAIVFVFPFMPNSSPGFLVPVFYMVGARFVAERYQMSKQAITQSEAYESHSAGNVAVITIGFLVAIIVLIVAWLLIASQLGMVTLD